MEELLKNDQSVVGIDNFSSGSIENLEAVRRSITKDQWKKFEVIVGDVRDEKMCRKICLQADYVLHQAAIVSVPQSFDDPLSTNETNVFGFVNISRAARDAGVKRLVYASSCAVYGSSATLPNREDCRCEPESPYAASKLLNELYANTMHAEGCLQTIGLRYFNVYGPRQSMKGAYASVIPKWISQLIGNRPVNIHGDGNTTRDFCHISDIVQANIVSAKFDTRTHHNIFNIGTGIATSLNELYQIISEALICVDPERIIFDPEYKGFRPGDINRSFADISKAKSVLGYLPTRTLKQGIRDLVIQHLNDGYKGERQA